MPTLRVPVRGSFVITAGSVMNGAGSPGQQCWIGRTSRSGSRTMSWTGAAPDRLRHRVGEALELPEALDLLDDALRRLHLEHVAELLADGVQGGLAEGHRHPPLRPELVGEQRVLGALEVLEEERRAAGLDRPVDDLRHLEIRVDLCLDLDQLAGAAKLVDPGAEVGRGHDLSLSG